MPLDPGPYGDVRAGASFPRPGDGSSLLDRRAGEAWRDDRQDLLALARKMLRGRADPEDVVQEAFGRLARADIDSIEDVRGWLMVVVRHLCLDETGSARARRDGAYGWLGEGAQPVGGQRPGDPADQVMLEDQVHAAFAVVLGRLTPAERTSFVLHDVFGFTFDGIGEIVGRSPTACRQLASRARRSIRDADAPARAGFEVTEKQIVAERFIAACAGGDMGALVAVLDPDVVGEATLEGRGPLSRVEGRDAVSKRVLELFGPETGSLLIPVAVEDAPGVVVVDDRRARAVFRLDQRNGQIRHLHALVRSAR